MADRIERQKHKPPPPPPKPKRPTFERPQLALKQKLGARLGNIQTEVALHHEREHAFEERYVERTWAKAQRQKDREARDPDLGNSRSRQGSRITVELKPNDQMKKRSGVFIDLISHMKFTLRGAVVAATGKFDPMRNFDIIMLDGLWYRNIIRSWRGH